MTDIDKVLRPSERIKYQGTNHWVIYMPTLLATFGCAGLVSMAVAQSLANARQPSVA